MSVLIWIVVAVLVVVLLLTFVGRRAAVGVDPTQLLLDPDLVGRVRALARSDQKVAAIKLLREGTPGLSLLSAKQMVDKMAVPPESQAPPPLDLTKSTGNDSEVMPSTSTVSLEVELQARSMKSAGQMIPAIKLVREHTSWGLTQAKDYVDSL